MKGAFKYFLIWLLLMAVGLIGILIVGLIVLGLASHGIDKNNISELVNNPWLFSVAMLGADLIILWVFWKRRYTRNWIEYGYTYGEGFSTMKLCLWAVVGAFGCLLLDVMVQEYVPIPDEPGLGEFFEVLFSNPLGVISVCLTGPLAEEAVFRGAIERRLLEKNWNPWFAIVISAILFAAVHGNYEQGVTAVIVGCFMGWVYYRTRSIWPCFLIHATNNITSVVAGLALPESMADSTVDTMGLPLSWGIPLIAVSMVMIYLAARGMGKLTRDRSRILEPVPVGDVLPPPFNYESAASEVITGYPMNEVSTGTPLDYTNGVDDISHLAEPDDDLPSDFNPQDS